MQSRRLLIPTLLAVAALAGPGASVAPAAPAERPYDGDTVIVKYRPGVEPPEQRPLLERAGAVRTVESIGAVDAEVVRTEADPARVADRLEESPKVAYAEPNFLMRAQARPPDDDRFSDLWGLRNVGQTGGTPGADIRALRGWGRAGLRNYPKRGGVRVGIVDTGIDLGHPDLAGKTVACTERVVPQLRTGGCADDTDHGTHVAGTIGATADNKLGVTGVAFNSPLVVCRALGRRDNLPDAAGRVSDIVKCIRWSQSQGARVISMSFAGGPSKTLRRAIRRAWKNGRRGGAVLVAAAGNGGGRQADYPAAYPQVISVGATNDRDGLAWFSNRHPTVELTAPGVGILSTRPGGGYWRLSGTSMAVPHASGVAAQVRGLHPKWRAGRVRKVIRRSADDRGASGRDPRFGFGRVNLAKALAR